MHKSLKRFGLEGEVGDDADFARLRAQWETALVLEMRGAGYVPVLNLGPFWSTVYDEDKDKYSFVLSMHGYRVGRRQACEIEGISADGKRIPRSTPASKSKPSSEKSE